METAAAHVNVVTQARMARSTTAALSIDGKGTARNHASAAVRPRDSDSGSWYIAGRDASGAATLSALKPVNCG
jgi:hypothetical protein